MAIRGAGSVMLVVCLGGCASNPFGKKDATPLSLEPPPGVAAPAHTLQPSPPVIAGPTPPSYANLDGRELEAALSRSRQETQVMQDEIAALRDQLASTSTQLAQERASGRPAVIAPPPAAETPAVIMESSIAKLSLPQAETRFDGGVVRVEIPADKLFEPGTANLLPGGTAILTQAAEQIEAVYPGHFVGIEGHVDTEPLHNASFGSPHQLTAARTAAAFDFFTSRTPLGHKQLFLVAHGANHPVVSNATAAGRARNRRIELVIYPERVGSGSEHPAAAADSRSSSPPQWQAGGP
jgi:flagellar motor protein MotB